MQSDTVNNLVSSTLSTETVNIACVDVMYCYPFFNNVHKNAVRQAWDIDINVGASLLEIIPESADRTALKHKLDRALEGETFVEIKEYGDIEKREWESGYGPMYNPEGDVIGVSIYSVDLTERKKTDRHYETSAFSYKKEQFALIFKDITERIKAEELLQKSVEQLALLAHHNPYGC